MGNILTLALKDLRLLSRDWFGLFWIFAFPLMFALFFGAIFGGDSGRSALPVGLVDEDHSDRSREFIDQLKGKKEALDLQPMSRGEAQDRVRKGRLVAYLVIKPGFGQTNAFYSGTEPKLELGIDPGRKAEAGYLQGLLMEASYAGMQKTFSDPKEATAQLKKALADIEKAKGMAPGEKKKLLDFMTGLEQVMVKADFKTPKGGDLPGQPARIQQVEVGRVDSRPLSAFEITFPSAVMWGLIGCMTSFAISLVTERVAGTLLRLRLAPLSFGQLLAGKGLACFLASVGVATFLLLLGNLVLGVRVENLAWLVLAVVCTAVCFVGIMMFLATLGKTEQGVAGAGWGILIPLAWIGGGTVPLIAMPAWMQVVSNFSPIKWAIEALEGAIWRGYTLGEMLSRCAVLVAVGVVCFGLGVVKLARSGG